MNKESPAFDALSAATDYSPSNLMLRFWPGRKRTTDSPLVDNVIPMRGPLTQAPPQRRLSGILPSPSVEPPRVSDYTLGTSPSPAYAALPDPQPPTRVGSDLQTIQETIHVHDASRGSETQQIRPGPHARSRALSSAMQSSTTDSTQQPDSTQLSSVHHSATSTFSVRPIEPAMNPESFKIGLIAGSGPRPPDDLVLHAEVARHGGVYEPLDTDPRAEASYQVEVTPPVPRQATPRPIFMDPAILAASDSPMPTPSKMETHSVAQVSPSRAIGNLLPPVASLPMVSPLVANMPPLPTEPISSEKQLQMETTTIGEGIKRPAFYDTAKPTCSLNLVCYRSGAKGCDLQQIQCVLRSLFPSDQSFETVIAANPHLVHTDDQFFHEMRRMYSTKMCGFFRRYFSLKSLRAFRVLAYTPTTRPTIVPFDDFVLQEMMYAYRNPDRLSSEDDWIQWVFRLRRKDRRHALEFVEGWNTTRIAISGTIPWLTSCLVGVIWTAVGGDPQTAFTVASFILTSSSIILALLAIISSIESSGGLSR
ncbi:hypothetical protein C7999DRAFT_13095 [Corynascus novoguineensis]|uniref:Transmembrane protein n=1 Tax=Corynascus novoguineensis TaxID=1126955 RepID=A0AAN7CW38_9PEZI|nr:hypothetical protein C7999DRAFT_13095 [Corynascus novoguineensis]